MYGIAISLGILISTLIAEHIVKKEKLNIEIYWGVVFISLIYGIIGARMYHVFDFYSYYLKYPLDIFKIWNGGLGIYGGIIGGISSSYMYLKIKKQNVYIWLNIFAIVLPLGQAIGRIGNIFNTEILPYAYYESSCDLILFLILISMYLLNRYKINSLKNIYLAIYLLGYGLIRLTLSGTRIDIWTWKVINVTQVISIFFILLGIMILMKDICVERKKQQ